MIHFHRFLIGTAILFCLGFGAWTVRAWQAGAAPGALVLGIAFIGAGLLLTYYLRNLRRFLHPSRR
jgi:hypothetical protein